MTIAYTKGAKRRNKARRDVADLYREFEREAAVIPPEPEEDPLKAPMQARARRLGVKPTHDVLAPYLETEAGKALHIAVKGDDERRDLLQVFLDYDRAVTLYSRRCLSRHRFPAVSKMEFMPERLETSADDAPVDTRSDEERAEGARKAMREWDALLSRLHIWQSNIIRSVSYQQETLVRQGELTTAGRSFVAAIKRLYDLTR